MKRIFFFLLTGLLFIMHSRAQPAHAALQISYLTGDFYIYTTYHSYKGNPVSANGLYLVTNEGVVMLDTPWDTTQFQPLLDSIENRHHQKVVMCIATHSHEDRTGGLEYYRSKGIKTYTTIQTDKICKEKNEKRAEFLILNDTVFTIGHRTFETYFPGAGHAPDNIVIWFPAEKILYGGCLVKSTQAIDLGYLGDANTQFWPDAIQNIQYKFPKPAFVIPGHQDWSNINSLSHTLGLLRKHNSKR